MARTKGALNKRTRAALYEAEHGKLEKAASSTLSFLSRIVTDRKREDAVRLQAANILLPYLRPKLSAVEQTNINPEDMQTEEELNANLVAMFEANPALFTQLLALRPKADETTDQVK